MSKKLQAEVEKAIKDIRLNLDSYDEKWNELLRFNQNRSTEKGRYFDESRKEIVRGKKHAIRTASLESMDFKHVNDVKAKIENDLEGSLRKLHRLKQQLIEWNSNCSDKDLRNKEELIDFKKQIELRYKRGKAFYKQGASSDNCHNIQSKQIDHTQTWIHQFIGKLMEQAESWQNEIEELYKSKKEGIGIRDRIEQLKAMVDLHQMNIRKLEGLSKAIYEERINIDDPSLDRLKRELEPYVEQNKEMLIIVTEDVYTEFGLAYDLLEDDDKRSDSTSEYNVIIEAPGEKKTNSPNSPTKAPLKSSESLDMTTLENGLKNNLKTKSTAYPKTNISVPSKPRQSSHSQQIFSNENSSQTPSSHSKIDPKYESLVSIPSSWTSPLNDNKNILAKESIIDKITLKKPIENLQATNSYDEPHTFLPLNLVSSSANDSASSTLVNHDLSHPSNSSSYLKSNELNSTHTKNQGSPDVLPFNHIPTSISPHLASSTNSANNIPAEVPYISSSMSSDHNDSHCISNKSRQMDTVDKNTIYSPKALSSPFSPHIADISHMGLKITDEAAADWKAHDKSQLSVTAGQKLFIQSRHSSGWTYGYNMLQNGETSSGWFPSSICKSVKYRQVRTTKIDHLPHSGDSFASPSISDKMQITVDPSQCNFPGIAKDETSNPVESKSTLFESSYDSRGFSQFPFDLYSISQEEDKIIHNFPTFNHKYSPITNYQTTHPPPLLDDQLNVFYHGSKNSTLFNHSFGTYFTKNLSTVHIFPDQLEVKEVRWNWNGELTDGSGTLLLTFKKGEMVEILAHHKTGWIFGRVKGQPNRLGWFPDYMLQDFNDLLPKGIS